MLLALEFGDVPNFSPPAGAAVTVPNGFFPNGFSLPW